MDISIIFLNNSIIYLTNINNNFILKFRTIDKEK